MPGGWVDDYTERQLKPKEFVQFQEHRAAPSIITCAKQAVGEAKRRCVHVAASACRAPIYLLTMAQNTHANITSTTMRTAHHTYDLAVYQIVRRVRQAQAFRRRRPASPRHSPRQSPRLSPRRSPQLTPQLQPQQAILPTPPQVFEPPTTPNRGISNTPTSMTSPMDWLSANDECKYINHNQEQESPNATQAPVSTCTAAEYQHGAEAEEAPKSPPSQFSAYNTFYNELRAEIEESISSYNEASSTHSAGNTEAEQVAKALKTPVIPLAAAGDQLEVGIQQAAQAQTSASSYAAAGNQLRKEIEEAISSSNDAPIIPLARNAFPVTPQRNIMKPYPSYMSGNDGDFSSNFLDTLLAQESIAIKAPSNNTSADRVLPVTPQRNILKPYPSHLSGRDSEFSSNVLDALLLQTSISSEEPINPSADKEHPVNVQGNNLNDHSSQVSDKDSSLSSIVPEIPFIGTLSLSDTPSIVAAENVLPVQKVTPVTPEHKVMKSHTSHISGRASGLSTDIPDAPVILKSSSPFDPFSPEYTDISVHVPVGPQEQQHEQDVTEFPSIVASAPELADVALQTTGEPEDNPVDSPAAEGEDFSSYVVDFPTPPITSIWYEEPAPSPFIKSRFTGPRRVTRQSVKDEMEAQAAKEAKKQSNLAKAKISTLSEEWEDRVSEAVRAGFAPDYTAADFARVVPPQRGGITDNWLNDESVNGYLKLATKYHNTDHPSLVPKSHAFPSFLLKQVAEKGYRGVERWAKRAKIGGKDLLKTHTIFIPVNSGNHWTLMVVYPGARIAHYYDSMNRHRSENGRKWFELLKIWLRGELGNHYNEREWSFFDKQSPQQDNCSDCGVFAVTTAKMLILGADVLGYGPKDIPLQRKRIVAELVNGGFL
jgi:Ulp1 protease family, C-terminal catalytic domain